MFDGKLLAIGIVETSQQHNISDCLSPTCLPTTKLVTTSIHPPAILIKIIIQGALANYDHTTLDSKETLDDS